MTIEELKALEAKGWPLPIDRPTLSALLAVAEACKGLMRRMEINELVNRPGNPCNHYDQPYYDAAKDALAALETKEPKR